MLDTCGWKFHLAVGLVNVGASRQYKYRNLQLLVHCYEGLRYVSNCISCVSSPCLSFWVFDLSFHGIWLIVSNLISACDNQFYQWTNLSFGVFKYISMFAFCVWRLHIIPIIWCSMYGVIASHLKGSRKEASIGSLLQ